MPVIGRRGEAPGFQDFQQQVIESRILAGGDEFGGCATVFRHMKARGGEGIERFPA